MRPKVMEVGVNNFRDILRFALKVREPIPRWRLIQILGDIYVCFMDKNMNRFLIV